MSGASKDSEQAESILSEYLKALFPRKKKRRADRSARLILCPAISAGVMLHVT